MKIRVSGVCAATALSMMMLAAPAAKKAKAQSKPAMTKVAAGDAAKGKEVFDQCAACHSADTDEKKMGPSLKGLYKHAKMKNGKTVSDDHVMDVINKGGNGMPAYEELLSAEEKANVVAYLHTL